MNIKITTDSTCDLSTELLVNNNIDVFNCYICHQGKSYLDKIEINSQDIFKYQDESNILCKTQSINTQTFYDYFEKESPHYDHIIHLSIGQKLSSCYQNAFLAAQDFPNVHIIDSNNFSFALGLLVLKAIELVKSENNIDIIINNLEEYKNKIHFSFVLSNLEYMQKGGRCSALSAYGASALKLKPAIDVLDGVLEISKLYRGDIKIVIKKFFADAINNCPNIDTSNLILAYSSYDEECIKTIDQVVKNNINFDNTMWLAAGCTVCINCGRNVYGLAFATK